MDPIVSRYSWATAASVADVAFSMAFRWRLDPPNSSSWHDRSISAVMTYAEGNAGSRASGCGGHRSFRARPSRSSFPSSLPIAACTPPASREAYTAQAEAWTARIRAYTRDDHVAPREEARFRRWAAALSAPFGPAATLDEAGSRSAAIALCA